MSMGRLCTAMCSPWRRWIARRTWCRSTLLRWTCFRSSTLVRPFSQWMFVRVARPRSLWLCHLWEPVRHNNKKCVGSVAMSTCIRMSVLCAQMTQ